MPRLTCAFLFVLLLVSGTVPATAQKTALLPDRFGQWEATGPVKTIQPQELGNDWGRGGNGDRILQETGLRAIEQRTYDSAGDEVTLRAFELRDPSSAFELYTFLIAPGMRNLGLGEDSALSQYDGRVLIGNVVLQATLSPRMKPEDLSDIVPVLKAKADPTPMPPLKTYLPSQWLLFGSQKYALGPEALRAAITSLGQGAFADLARSVGFQNGAEAILARYQSDRDAGVLLLLEYPTPQVAEQQLHHLQEALPKAAKQAGVNVERRASLLSLVFAASSPQYAQTLRNEVNYETQVTWNEPSHSVTDPPWMVIVGKIFLFTCLFLGIATGVGVAFGGLRVLIKRLFPGKVFDRPQDIEVLQLGLTGKKIDPTDMY